MACCINKSYARFVLFVESVTICVCMAATPLRDHHEALGTSDGRKTASVDANRASNDVVLVSSSAKSQWRRLFVLCSPAIHKLASTFHSLRIVVRVLVPARPAQAFASTSNTQTAKSYKDAQTHTEDLQANIAAKEQRPYRPEWNKILSSFFEDAGLFQALSGLKDDLLVMNEEWERVRIPEALHVLVNDLSVGKSSFNAAENDSVEMMQLLSQELVTEGSSNTLPEKPLAEKKLEAIKPQNRGDLQTPPAVSGSSEISRTWVN